MGVSCYGTASNGKWTATSKYSSWRIDSADGIEVAEISPMIAALAIIGFAVIGLAIGLIVTAAAPVGYQDETGFHYGRPDGRHEEEIPLAVPQPKLA